MEEAVQNQYYFGNDYSQQSIANSEHARKKLRVDKNRRLQMSSAATNFETKIIQTRDESNWDKEQELKRF